MNYREIIHTAWSSILSNKLRSILTMLGVIIGVAAVIMMIAIGAGTEATIAEQINGLGSNLIFISESFNRGGPNEGPTNQQGGLKYTDVAAIRDQVKGIAGVSVERSADNLTAKFNDITLESLTLVGTTPDFLTVRGLAIGSGRFFTDDEVTKASKVVVLGKTVAETLFPDSDPLGQVISVDNVNLTVIGVMAPKGLVSGTDFDAQIYSPIQLVFKKFTPSMFARIVGDRVRTIYVSVEEGGDMQSVINQVTILLANRHKVSTDSLDFNIRTQSDIIKTQESTTASFRTLLAGVAGVSLIVGGIGIMNIMLVSVTERTREIGLRQAIGATPLDIRVQFLSEALMLSLFGGILGVIVGVGGSYLYGAIGGMRTVVLPYSVLLSFLSSAIVGIFFGYVPAKNAAELDPIVALRHE
jgi:putative ABC transport system permease protein